MNLPVSNFLMSTKRLIEYFGWTDPESGGVIDLLDQEWKTDNEMLLILYKGVGMDTHECIGSFDVGTCRKTKEGYVLISSGDDSLIPIYYLLEAKKEVE